MTNIQYPMTNIQNQLKPIKLLLLLCILHLSISFILTSVSANESLRIAGMGGAYAGLYSTEGGIFSNPAGLINTQDNNISFAFLVENLAYESLPTDEGQQLNADFSLRLSPSVYYSRVIHGFGISLGYIGDLNNRNSTFKIEDTEAEYIIDERKFASNTNTIFDYDFFRESGPVLSVGYSLKPEIAIGARLKYLKRIVKKGTIYRPLQLSAVHGPDVNRNDATKLLPAIIDNLDISKAIDNFKEGEGGHEEVEADLSGSGLDFDIGMQTKLLDRGNISGGVMLEHLIQRRLVRPEPSKLTIGLITQPKGWLAAAFDLQKAIADNGFNANIGWEVNYRWERWFSGGIMLRNGFSHESSAETKNRLSIGLGLILGSSHWDYALVKPIDDSPISKATHIFSSTTRF